MNSQIILFIISTCMSSVLPLSFTDTFSRLDDKDIAADSFIVLSETFSLIECASECKLRPDCEGFFYEDQTCEIVEGVRGVTTGSRTPYLNHGTITRS